MNKMILVTFLISLWNSLIGYGQEINRPMINNPYQVEINGDILPGMYFKVLTDVIKSDNAQYLNVYINSRGGRIDVAEGIVQLLADKTLTCYIDNAYSAALQIIMPLCSKIYTHSGANFGFHNAVIIFPINAMASAPVLYELFKEIKQMTVNMSNNMNNKWGGDTKCPKELMAKWSELAITCTEALLYESPVVGPHQLNYLWGKQVVVVLPYELWPIRRNPMVLRKKN